MKKIILFGIILVLLVLLISTAGAETRVITSLTAPPIETYHIMRVTMINQMPDPAEPGKYVDVRFKFENNGSRAAENVEAEIIPQYPFSLDPGTSAVKSLGSINPKQKGDNGVIVKFRLRVDKDALEGQSEIKLRYRTIDNIWLTMPEFKINIQPYDAILLLDKVASFPETIKPGQTATIGVTFKNMAEILLKKIRVKIKLDGVPLAPIGSTNEKTIEKIDKNEEAQLMFNLIAEPDAKSNIYKVPIEYVYYDSLGNNYNRNSTIGVIIGSEPDLAVTLDSATIYQSEKPGSVIIKIVNKDVNEIKFLNVRLAESKDYKIISPNEVYVGNIDTDDYETAEFKLFVNEKKSKEIPLNITLNFRDAINKMHSKNINLELKMYSTAEAKQLGLIKGNNTVGILILLAIVGYGISYYFGKRKKMLKKM